MDISYATPTTLESTEHVALAEELGYKRAWFYDTPQQSPDVWMMLALAAERTERIGLGPGVLVPSLRHPMVNAAATAALEALAPGRVAVAFGTGFTGRRAMGVPGPIKWSYMEAYIQAYKGLLRGDTVEWEGARMRMLHQPGHAAPRPVEVPVLIGAQGPKGQAMAAELADGLFTVAAVPDRAKEFSWVPHLCYGTVLEEGEEPNSDRVRAAAGPGTVLALHAVYEYDGPVAEMPGGAAWLEHIERVPEAERHLTVHEQHCVGLNDADAAAWADGAHALLKGVTVSGTRDEVRERLAALAEQGATEIVYQPMGPDIRRELETFMEAAGTAASGTP